MNAVMGLLRVQMCTTAVKGGERGMKGTSSGSPSCTALSSSPFTISIFSLRKFQLSPLPSLLLFGIIYPSPPPPFPLVVVVSCGFCAAGSAVGAAGGDIWLRDWFEHWKSIGDLGLGGLTLEHVCRGFILLNICNSHREPSWWVGGLRSFVDLKSKDAA